MKYIKKDNDLIFEINIGLDDSEVKTGVNDFNSILTIQEYIFKEATEYWHEDEAPIADEFSYEWEYNDEYYLIKCTHQTYREPYFYCYDKKYKKEELFNRDLLIRTAELFKFFEEYIEETIVPYFQKEYIKKLMENEND